ncbi:hypothetical protein L3X38_010137 [Prunus dulcis]|uniref:RNase H type-1 domain-containing protein n=2 Tax=Prunus dulcis TaxID=3755 RepID=A0AAD4ZD10_PRUDU|nr:hypothetical protein L3X38_010137 [Prunus dulcis]
MISILCGVLLGMRFWRRILMMAKGWLDGCLHPPFSVYKINIDASWVSTTLQAGLGVVVRNSASNFIGGCCVTRLASSAIEAEAHAALKGVKLAAEMGLPNVVFESDSKELVQSIKGNILKGRWMIYPILSTIRRQCSSFISCSWHWVPRGANRAADAAAQRARRRMCDKVWASRPPSSLVFVLQADGLPCPPRC